MAYSPQTYKWMISDVRKYLETDDSSDKEEVWYTNLLITLEEKSYPKPQDCINEMCLKWNEHWCGLGVCKLAARLCHPGALEGQDDIETDIEEEQ
jgi:hypothetical protein